MSNENSSKRPTHTAYSVREYTKNGQKESDWNRVGVAWAHKDGDGFDIVLDAIPVNGRIAVRKNKPKQEGQQG